MPTRFASLATAALAAALLAASPAFAGDDGLIRVKSAYSIDESIARVKKDVSAKGIQWFAEIDQAALAAGAGVKILPSTLLVFGNPPLGTLFIQAKAEAGLDWPVRLLISQDAQGQVWATYTDFRWIAARHGIRDRDAEFATATGVIASITSTLRP